MATTAARRLAVDQRVVSGRCGQPAVDLVGQLRGRRHDARRRRHRRDQLHQRSVDAAREGDLPRRGRAVSGREGSTSRGARPTSGGSTATTTPTRSPTRRSPCSRRSRRRRDARDERSRCRRIARRGARLVARRRLQEDQVLHERERRLGRARSARAADAHHRLLADRPARGHGCAAVCADDRRDGVVGLSFAMRQVAQLLLMCDRQDIGISIGSGERGRQSRSHADRRTGHACPTSRASSSTTTIPAASASASRCSRWTRSCGAHARADCRLRVPAGLPDLRRADRQHRARWPRRWRCESSI